MIPPQKTTNEPERLQVLYHLNLLDTGAEERFDRITRIACKLFDVPIAFVSLVDANRQWFKSSQGLVVQETARDISFCGHAILADELMIVEDAAKDERFHDNPLVIGTPNVRFYVGCPLKINEHNVGTLCLADNQPRRFKQADVGIIYDLAKMVELELESLHLSTTDDLTGLSNRRGFLKIANHIFKLCEREAKTFTLLFFDLDKFKQINDMFGHTEGDLVLKIFSQALVKTFRSADAIARLGGDEFCVLCSGLEQEEIPIVIERFRYLLNADQQKAYQIHCSVGGIEYQKEEHKTLNDLLVLADLKMYQNKKGTI